MKDLYNKLGDLWVADFVKFFQVLDKELEPLTPSNAHVIRTLIRGFDSVYTEMSRNGRPVEVLTAYRTAITSILVNILVLASHETTPNNEEIKDTVELVWAKCFGGDK